METPKSQSDVRPSAAADDSTKRKRQPRNSACQACASLKMKCVPGPALGKCERCHRMERECLPSLPKPRKRRTLNGDLGDDTPARLSREDAAAVGAAPKQAGEQDQGRRHSLLSAPNLSYQGSKSFRTLFAQGLGIEASAGDLLEDIDYNAVQTSFTIFRQLIGGFPLISLRPDVDAVAMATDRPMTTLAMCAAASSGQPDRQGRLAQAFRLALAAKVIMQCERSIDLFVGLLIFLTWHHNYMAKQQIHQMTYLVAGMAADLGFYQQPWRNDQPDVDAAVERDRAFLLSYYMCCGMTVMGFNKVSPLRWTDNLRKCAANVASFGSQRGDRIIVGLIELTKVIEDLDDDVRQEANLKRSTAAAYVDMLTKASMQRLKTLRREHPGLGESLGYGAARVHIYQMALRASESPDTTTLVQCACAIKEYIDDILSRTPALLHRLPIIDWTNLLEVLVIMSRITRSLPSSAGWEAGALSTMLQPDAVLDSIYAHMAAAPVGDVLAPRHEAQLQWFKGVCENIKKRLLHEKTDNFGVRGSAASHYDTVHSLGQKDQPAQSRFKPVNEPYTTGLSVSEATVIPDLGSFDTFDLFDNGVLDDSFWTNFLNS